MLVTRIMFFGILIVVAQKDVVARKFRNPTLHCVSDKEVVVLLRSFDEHLSPVYALEFPHAKPKVKCQNWSSWSIEDLMNDVQSSI